MTLMIPLTDLTTRQLITHIAGQHHAMAGASIALSAATACALGEACVGISMLHLTGAGDKAEAVQTAGEIDAIRQRLLALTDEDGAAITAFVALREAGKELEGQDILCQMPGEMGRLIVQAAALLQDFRPLVRQVQDDLEMTINLLVGAARACTLLLDSNLRLWPDPALLAAHEPVLQDIRERLQGIKPAERVRS